MQSQLSTQSQEQDNDRGNGRLLRRTLQANGIFSTLCALLMIVTAQSLSTWIGPPPIVFVVMGLSFIPFILFIFYIAHQPQINRTHARLILALDIAWVVLTPLVLFTGWLPMAPEGKWIIALTSDVVLVLAILEYVGLRRLA